MATEAENSIGFHQQRGMALDIIDEALNAYDGWMLDDDYDATTTLHKIMKRMRERVAALNHSPA